MLVPAASPRRKAEKEPVDERTMRVRNWTRLDQLDQLRADPKRARAREHALRILTALAARARAVTIHA